ncbi:unnamed protein product [Pleuronectes platessa]|uniref:Uncharacterized protein n=1 Tax=Pleuronectes platessa TaxID=8262 RepID=A0A9N7V932_PLEPL|nr:unnamed protein product [Pleuronectes platessa]
MLSLRSLCVPMRETVFMGRVDHVLGRMQPLRKVGPPLSAALPNTSMQGLWESGVQQHKDQSYSGAPRLPSTAVASSLPESANINSVPQSSPPGHRPGPSSRDFLAFVITADPELWHRQRESTMSMRRFEENTSSLSFSLALQTSWPLLNNSECKF